ncbi:molybdenum cofactor biosynthesis protein MoaE [Sediminitomix flava]|uniref:Molybdopterin synthase catalytic subunit n=1 Tax=Sediminitomix flava TaxID=379075 RepID=A0A315ZGS8_SEDFL|nr:molybdenum cofactor biosynthesis protein MoaE [Sediminitomix flava]PWJ44330.1 molybdopterin synthase catalytic subunit [Sediminitomix flava]
MEKKKKNVFVEGAISPEFIANSIAKHQTKTTIGAHDIFLGQVRADEIDGKTVSAIEYSCYQEMAENSLHEIREETFSKFDELTCMHIYHSLGKVKTGEICLFVFVSSKHRTSAFEACQYLVERIKKEVAIYGKELFEDESYVWKENTKA